MEKLFKNYYKNKQNAKKYTVTSQLKNVKK